MADRLYVNARIRTGDPRRPWADAMLVREGRVVAIGSSAELRKRADNVEVIDALGAEMTRESGRGDAHNDSRREE